MSRTDINIEHNIQNALTKLLLKLNLIEADVVPANWQQIDSCPIHYFAAKLNKNEGDLIAAVANKLDIPVLNVTHDNIRQLILNLEDHRFSSISVQKWRELRAIPVTKLSSEINFIAMANPLDQNAIKFVELETNCKFQAMIASEHQVLQILNKQLATTDSVDLSSIISEVQPQPRNDAFAHQFNEHDASVFGEDLESPPVIRLVNKILAESIEKNASDIHIVPEKGGLNVKIRVDGLMHSISSIPASLQNSLISRIKLLSGMNIAEKRKPQDGRFRIKVHESLKDLRVSTVPIVYGENIVIRILSADLKKLDFQSLGMMPDMQSKLERELASSSRVILVTGPTGSGKTSSLYASLMHLRDGKRNIITIEDPIEYKISGINQIQVNPKVGLTFAESLRSVLRQDPDVVMVGEIRDAETAATAMQVAQTGHLVLSTLHTNSAVASIIRLVDIGVPNYIIASSVGAILAQRLVRKLCNHCCESIDENYAEHIKQFGLTSSNIRAAKGCAQCDNTGYSGRVAIYSLLQITDQIREAIRNNSSEHTIEQLAINDGFKTLTQAAIECINNGTTSLEEVERVIGPFPKICDEKVSTPIVQNMNSISKRKILLVEDDENTRSILSMLLQNQFYDVIEAANGIEGLEKIYNERTELVVCDLMMPKMGGLEFVKKIKGDPRTKNIPVLMLTAVGNEENEYQLISSGADDFVHKGSETRVLVARIERLINR